MSVTLIDTIVEDEGYLLDNSGDQLLTTSAGALIEDDGLNCVQVNNSGTHTITDDGLFYAEDGGDTVAVQLDGGSTNLFVNGQLEGDIGVEATEAFDATTANFISVGSQGSIVGLATVAVEFAGNGSGATNDRVSNAGEISAVGTAIAASSGGGDHIVNHGSIDGSVGVGFASNLTTETVNNTGTIEGGNALTSAAIDSVGSSAGIAVVNTGVITDGSSNPIASAANGDFGVLFSMTMQERHRQSTMKGRSSAPAT